MVHALLQLLLYALLASFSALGLAATIAAMQTGRLKALAFGAGFLSGQLFTCTLLVAIGGATVGSNDRHPRVQAVLELLIAVALIVLAVRVRARGPIERMGAANARGRVLLERLGRLRMLTMVLAGLLLGIGGPKRLLLTAFAATTISTAGVGGVREPALVVWYVALGSAIVWAPVVLFFVLGERIVRLMSRAQEALARHQKEAIVYALFVLAAFFAVDALTVL